MAAGSAVIVGIIVVACLVFELILLFEGLRSRALFGSLVEIVRDCRRSRFVAVLWVVWTVATALAVHTYVYWALTWLAVIWFAVSIVAALAAIVLPDLVLSESNSRGRNEEGTAHGDAQDDKSG